jgi:hypothetical protein
MRDKKGTNNIFLQYLNLCKLYTMYKTINVANMTLNVRASTKKSHIRRKFPLID